jgi:hypothetical protein
LKIKKGKILVYRVYDIGSEVKLDEVFKMLEQSGNLSRFKLDRNYKMNFVLSTSPLNINLGTVEIPFFDKMISVELSARLWHFGTLSLSFNIPILEGTSFDDLLKIAHFFENDTVLDGVARSRAKSFQDEIKPLLQNESEWHYNEDYVIYFLQEIEGLEGGAINLLKNVDVPALILGEMHEKLSDQIKSGILENTYQYSVDDLAVIDWNSAVVIEPSGSMDVPLVIEFALSQLLEMRYYDDLLDSKLNTLYNEVAIKKRGILSNRYSKIAEEAGRMYLEIAEVVESVENSLKVVGDFYHAKIFRAASVRFRFKDWQHSIDEKLSNLAEVSKLLHSQVAESRSEILEFVIMLMIAYEAFPFIRDLFHK